MARAGSVVLWDNDGKIKARCMIPSDPDYGGTMPQMPKGQVDSGYTLLQTAIKEAEEEIGLIKSNIDNVDFVETIDRISVFLVTVKNPNTWDEPHYETGWSGWVDVTNNLNKIRPRQRAMFQAAVNKFKEIQDA